MNVTVVGGGNVGTQFAVHAAEKGYKVQVVYMTHHWAQLYRPHELLDGLWTAGIRNYPVIGPFKDVWADSLKEAERFYTRYDVAAFFTEQIRRFKPSVIIGHDLKGEYGHGMHVLNAVSLTDAVLAATDASCFADSAAKYGTWNTPKLYLHLYPENEIVMDWSKPLSAFDGKTAMEVAKEAFALHETQQGFFYVYGEGDEQSTKTPHFHVQIDNGAIESEIKFEHIRTMEIWRTKNNYPKSWDGITNVRDRIIEWLDEKPIKNYGVTNLVRMIMAWNDGNPTNEIDEQFTE